MSHNLDPNPPTVAAYAPTGPYRQAGPNPTLVAPPAGGYPPARPKRSGRILAAVIAAGLVAVGLLAWRSAAAGGGSGHDAADRYCQRLRDTAAHTAGTSTAKVTPGATLPPEMPVPPAGAAAECTLTVTGPETTMVETFTLYPGHSNLDAYVDALREAGFRRTDDPGAPPLFDEGVALFNPDSRVTAATGRWGELSVVLTTRLKTSG